MKKRGLWQFVLLVGLFCCGAQLALARLYQADVLSLEYYSVLAQQSYLVVEADLLKRGCRLVVDSNAFFNKRFYEKQGKRWVLFLASAQSSEGVVLFSRHANFNGLSLNKVLSYWLKQPACRKDKLDDVAAVKLLFNYLDERFWCLSLSDFHGGQAELIFEKVSPRRYKLVMILEDSNTLTLTAKFFK